MPVARRSRNQGQPANYADIDDRSDEHEGNKHLRKNRHTAGDHIIFIGEVLALGVDSSVEPLLFHLGKYRYFRDL